MKLISVQMEMALEHMRLALADGHSLLRAQAVIDAYAMCPEGVSSESASILAGRVEKLERDLNDSRQQVAQLKRNSPVLDASGETLQARADLNSKLYRFRTCAEVLVDHLADAWWLKAADAYRSLEDLIEETER